MTDIAEAVVATPRDPAWPTGCTVTLWRVARLPHGRIAEWSAYRSHEAARDAAEKDCGVKLAWQGFGSPKKGEAKFYSEAIQYKGGFLAYRIQVWPSQVNP